MTSLDVYGWRGWEMEIDNHIKTRVIFAIVDRKPSRLAWFMFAQDIPERWEGAFDMAGMGYRNLDRNEDFGTAIAYPTLNSMAGSDIRTLAPQIGSVLGSPATLEMTDEKDGTTSCSIRGLVDSTNSLVDLDFDLVTAGSRREMNIKRNGRVYLLGAGKFSVAALKRGIRGAIPLTHNVDPYNPEY